MRQAQLPEHWQQWIEERSKDRKYPNELGGPDFNRNTAVHLWFLDGSSATFTYAFCVSNEAHNELAVFTEHCGYHVFPLNGVNFQQFRPDEP